MERERLKLLSLLTEAKKKEEPPVYKTARFLWGGEKNILLICLLLRAEWAKTNKLHMELCLPWVLEGAV
jgi:hypothetical protein